MSWLLLSGIYKGGVLRFVCLKKQYINMAVGTDH